MIDILISLFSFMSPDVIGIFAGILGLVAFIPYIISIVQGRTKPNRATWWIWTLVSVLIYLSYNLNGAHDTIWLSLAWFVGPLIISLLSFTYGVGGWDSFDRICLMIAFLSIIPWFFFQATLATLLMNLFIDFIGALPTFRKVHRDPKSEDTLTWLLFFSASLLNVFAVTEWLMAVIIYISYFLVVDSLILFLIFRGFLCKSPSEK